MTTAERIEKLQKELDELKSSMSTELKKGQWIYIRKFPNEWSSRLNGNYPGKITYPFIAKIDDLLTEGLEYVPMSAGGYGWNLSAFDDGDVRLATEEEIKEKLISMYKEKGYEGRRIKLLVGWSKGDESQRVMTDGAYTYSKFNDNLSVSDRSVEYTVYENGEWAEIVDSLTFAGKPVEITDNEVKCCGETGTHEQVLDIWKVQGLSFGGRNVKFVIGNDIIEQDELYDKGIKIGCQLGSRKELEDIVKEICRIKGISFPEINSSLPF
jgi:hypothetical protein